VNVKRYLELCSCDGADSSVAVKFALGVYERFVQPGSIYDINILMATRRAVSTRLSNKEFGSKLFSEARDEVVDILVADKMSRFIVFRTISDEWERTEAWLAKQQQAGGVGSIVDCTGDFPALAAGESDVSDAELVDSVDVDLAKGFMLSPEFLRPNIDLINLRYPPRRHASKTVMQPSLSGSYSCHGHESNGARVNQDRGLTAYPFRHRQDQALFIVSDGHGPDGHHVADFVTRTLFDRLQLSTLLDKDPEEALKQACVEVDEALAYAGATIFDEDQMKIRKGTHQKQKTITVNHPQRKSVFVADVNSPQARRTSTFNKYFSAGRIAGGKVSPFRLNKTTGFDTQTSGATAVVTFMRGTSLWTACVGDCRVIIGKRSEDEPNTPAPTPGPSAASESDEKAFVRARRGSLLFKPRLTKLPVTSDALTVDQTTDNEAEVARIEKAGGVVEPAPGYMQLRVWKSHKFDGPGLSMCRSFGDHASRKLGVIPDPVVTYHELQPDDQFMILATDGVFSYMSNQAAVERVWACLDKWRADPARADFAAKLLVKFAMKFWRTYRNDGFCDDLCATVVCFPCFRDSPREERKES
jgi:serine/threonine protein phosphatase PrpC